MPTQPPKPESAQWRKIARAIAGNPEAPDRVLAYQLRIAQAHVEHVRAAMTRAEARMPQPAALVAPKPPRPKRPGEAIREAILAAPDTPPGVIARELEESISTVWKVRAQMVREGVVPTVAPGPVARAPRTRAKDACPHCGASKDARARACKSCHQRMHPPPIKRAAVATARQAQPPQPRPAPKRERWEVEAEALAAQIRAEPDEACKHALRLQLLRVRYRPWKDQAKRGRAA